MRCVLAALFLFAPIDLAVNTQRERCATTTLTSNKFARNNFPQLQNCRLSTPHQMEDGLVRSVRSSGCLSFAVADRMLS